MLRDWQTKYPGRIENMAAALQNLVPSHCMDSRHFDFKGLQTTGVADPDGDTAFDDVPLPSASALARIAIREL